MNRHQLLACASAEMHPGECWDGTENCGGRCYKARRPKNWDTQQRAECNR